MRLQGGEYINIGGGVAHISFSGEGRLHLGDKYVFVSMHHYCGPEFYCDKAMTKPYVFTENCSDDPIWTVFEAWHKNYMDAAKKAGKYWSQEDYLNGEV